MEKIQGNLQPGGGRERGFGKRGCNGTNRRSLTGWELKERGIGQRRSHGTNPRSLTSCEVKGEGNWSAQIAWHESEVTYILRGEGRGELVSADRMERSRGHLHARR